MSKCKPRQISVFRRYVVEVFALLRRYAACVLVAAYRLVGQPIYPLVKGQVTA